MVRFGIGARSAAEAAQAAAPPPDGARQHLAKALPGRTPQPMAPTRPPLLYQTRALLRLAHEAVRPLKPVLAARDAAEAPVVEPTVTRAVEHEQRLQLRAPDPARRPVAAGRPVKGWTASHYFRRGSGRGIGRSVDLLTGKPNAYATTSRTAEASSRAITPLAAPCTTALTAGSSKSGCRSFGMPASVSRAPIASTLSGKFAR